MTPETKVALIIAAYLLSCTVIVVIWFWADRRRLKRGMEEDREIDRYP